MRMQKLTLKEDKSKRLTSSGADMKNYQPPKMKKANIKMGKNPTTMLSKGNNLKPDGLKPKMASIKNGNSPRMNSFHKGY